MTRRRVLALRALEQPARDRRRAGLRRAALERLDVAEPERLEVGQVEAPDGASDVPERVRAFVSPLGRIRQLTRADGIEHDHAGPRHAGSLRTAWKPSSDSSSCCSTSLAILALSAAVTCAVVKISPAKRTPKPDKARGRPTSPGRAAVGGSRASYAALIASASGVYGSPWASATASYVILPPTTLTPFASAGSSAIARATPLSAIAST